MTRSVNVHAPIAAGSDQRAVPVAGSSTWYPCPGWPTSTTDPATAAQAAARDHTCDPLASEYPLTVPPASTTATVPAATAQPGWSPVRTVHAGAGSASVWLRSSQPWTAGSGLRCVATE